MSGALKLRVVPTDPPSQAVLIRFERGGGPILLTAPPADIRRALTHLLVWRGQVVMFIRGHSAAAPRYMLRPGDEVLAAVTVPARSTEVHASHIHEEHRGVASLRQTP